MTSWDHYSNYETEEVVGVAAAVYVVTSIAEPSIRERRKTGAGRKPSLSKDKSRKEDATFSASRPGTVSEYFSGEGSKKVSSEREEIKEPVIKTKDEKATRRAPSFKRSPSYGDHIGSSSRTQPRSSTQPVRLSSRSESAAQKPERTAPKPDHHVIKPETPARRPEPPPTMKPGAPVTEAERQSVVTQDSDQARAEAWEKAEMAKIKERYAKLDGTILAWEEKKKTKARSKLEKAEKSESEKKRTRALAKFRNEMDYIKQVADGARAEAMARQRNDELKAKEKANIIRTTGDVPVTCFCCQI